MRQASLMLTPELRAIVDDAPEVLRDMLIEMVEFYASEIDRLAKAGGPLSDILDGLYEIAETHNNEKPKGKEISCRKGCSHCCRIQVLMTPAEADLIKQYCEENSIAIDYDYFEKQKDLTEENHARSAANACAFLKDNLCSIYEVRPFACRNYFVVSDPDLCDVVKNPKTQVMRFINVYKHALHSALVTYLLIIKKQEVTQDSMARIFLNRTI